MRFPGINKAYHEAYHGGFHLYLSKASTYVLQRGAHLSKASTYVLQRGAHLSNASIYVLQHVPERWNTCLLTFKTEVNTYFWLQSSVVNLPENPTI